MESLRAGYERLRRRTERVGDKVMKQALNSGVGSQVRQVLSVAARQYTIGGRTIVEERQISEGGFAFVWMVRDAHTSEELALKKIVCQDRERLAMARREVDLLERLPPHPNIVRYYGHTVCDTDSRAKEVLLLFELCTGGHLLHLLERNKGVLEEEHIVRVMTDLCMAVAVLHLQSPPIQHRDLKVENVLLGADGKFKLCDFGSWSDECTDPSTLEKKQTGILQEQIERYTTMMYRPPEMVDFYQQFTISEKVDIWMLGCVLYTLMFYRHPFQDESTLAIANARYTMPSSPTYSEKLQDLTQWLLARDPTQRPSSIQLLEVLQNFSSGASLPLPRPAAENKEEPPAKARRPPKARQHHRHSKRHERREEEAAAGAGFWAKADLAQGGEVPVWPPVAVPEPSRAWATFDSCVDFQQGPAPGAAPAAGAGGGGRRPSAPDAWLGASVPSAGSRAPPPCDVGHASCPLAAPPLAFSGRSTQSGKSSTSHRSTSAVSGCSAPARTERSYPSESPGGPAAASPGGASSPARSSPGRSGGSGARGAGLQDGGGDFWSLAAAENTNQPWDPFARHVQWPGLTGPPSLSPASGAHPRHGAAPEADAGEGRSVTPPRQRFPSGGSHRSAGASQSSAASSAPAPQQQAQQAQQPQHPGEHAAAAPPGGEAPAEAAAPGRPAGAAAPGPWAPWPSERRPPPAEAPAAARPPPAAAAGPWPPAGRPRPAAGPPEPEAAAWPRGPAAPAAAAAAAPGAAAGAAGAAFAPLARHRRTASAPQPTREPERPGAQSAAELGAPGGARPEAAQAEPPPSPWDASYQLQGFAPRGARGCASEGLEFGRAAWPS